MKLYKVDKFSKEITDVESERQTVASVFINGNRNKWKSKWTVYFKTFDAAKSHLVARYCNELNALRAKIETAEDNLEYVKLIKNA